MAEAVNLDIEFEASSFPAYEYPVSRNAFMDAGNSERTVNPHNSYRIALQRPVLDLPVPAAEILTTWIWTLSWFSA